MGKSKIEQAKLDREREKKERENDRHRNDKLAKTRTEQAPEYEDYDADDDTDMEVLLTSLHCGYLVRTKGRCARPQKRWCELSKSGVLHLTGKSDVLAVNLSSKDYYRRFQVADDVRSDAARRVRHPTNGTWELLKAEQSEAKAWQRAFSDAIRLG